MNHARHFPVPIDSGAFEILFPHSSSALKTNKAARKWYAPKKSTTPSITRRLLDQSQQRQSLSSTSSYNDRGNSEAYTDGKLSCKIHVSHTATVWILRRAFCAQSGELTSQAECTRDIMELKCKYSQKWLEFAWLLDMQGDSTILITFAQILTVDFCKEIRCFCSICISTYYIFGFKYY
jgi:hypothetical protein